MMPNFQLHYNQGYAARPAPAIVAPPMDSELTIHEEIARAKEPRFVLRTISDKYDMSQSRAYQGLLQSALGFEPTEHSDAPPYIPTTPTAKPKPCVDFGFEPTEASE